MAGFKWNEMLKRMINPSSVGSELDVMTPLTAASQFSVSSTIILRGRPPPPLEGQVNFIFSIAPDHKRSHLMLPFPIEQVYTLFSYFIKQTK